ncbi:MAG TPA: hypothetical protein PKD53_33230 [Chloroflexaceae bacterium]|nr:hypothetical protein [Chloroflexaceae bacterium]
MNLKTFTRWSGYLLALGGLLLICAEVAYMLTPEGKESILTPTGRAAGVFFFSGAIFLTLGLPGVYVRQAEAAGRLGLGAFFTVLAGSALMIASDWSELFAAPAMLQIPGFEESFPPELIAGFMLNYGLYTLGWLLFGVATLRAKVFPRPLAILLIAGILLPFVGMFALHFPGDFMPCYLAFAWLGVAAARGPRPSPAALGEPLAA